MSSVTVNGHLYTEGDTVEYRQSHAETWSRGTIRAVDRSDSFRPLLIDEITYWVRADEVRPVTQGVDDLAAFKAKVREQVEAEVATGEISRSKATKFYRDMGMLDEQQLVTWEYKVTLKVPPGTSRPGTSALGLKIAQNVGVDRSQVNVEQVQ